MNQISKIAVFFTGFLLLTISSCKKDEPATPVDIGFGYYPTNVGRYNVYDVDSIARSSFTKLLDTFKFQIKEVIESEYLDNTGRPTLRLERYRKNYSKTIPYSQMKWILTDVWSTNRTNTSVEKTEENVRYVKLIFPVVRNKTWNGNAYNTNNGWDYKYTEVDRQKTIGEKGFDSTLTVIQHDQENFIDKKYYKEMYAKNKGLIYKEIIDVHSDSISALPLLLRSSTYGILKYTATIIDSLSQ